MSLEGFWGQSVLNTLVGCGGSVPIDFSGALVEVRATPCEQSGDMYCTRLRVIGYSGIRVKASEQKSSAKKAATRKCLASPANEPDTPPTPPDAHPLCIRSSSRWMRRAE